MKPPQACLGSVSTSAAWVVACGGLTVACTRCASLCSLYPSLRRTSHPAAPPPHTCVPHSHMQVLDSAQFIVLSGQLSGSGTPWVVKYFIEYFTPLTGLVPVVAGSAFPELG